MYRKNRLDGVASTRVSSFSYPSIDLFDKLLRHPDLNLRHLDAPHRVQTKMFAATETLSPSIETSLVTGRLQASSSLILSKKRLIRLEVAELAPLPARPDVVSLRAAAI